MNEITLKQFREITGYSKPTAYKHAKKYGRKDETIEPHGQWFLAYDYVALLVTKELAIAQQKHNRLLALGNGHQ